MKNKTVVVSRKWNSPTISITVCDKEIRAEMSLADFLVSLAEHVGNPTMLVTKTALKTKLRGAADAVTSEMKSATRHAM